ncbi:MAG: alpha/beta hydrolase [Gammaproteobacteria bacterium]|nr:alpha/beta hydrolase [Gammaproteobacteria bacterium]
MYRELTRLLPLLAVLLTGCQATAVINGLTPTSGYTLIEGHGYGDDPRQRLDIYLPDRPKPNAPVVVFVYGGAWTSGDRGSYRFVGQALSELGYVTVIPDYRLFPAVAYPDFVDDIARAMAQLPGHLEAHGCRAPLAVALAGHSAGAHTAALLATAPAYRDHRPDNVELVGLIGIAGPYDLPLDDPLVTGKFDRRRDNRSVNPVALAGPETPPTLLLHGAADVTVSPRHTQAFEQALLGHGVAVEAVIYPDAGHRTIIGALAAPLRFLQPTRDDMDRFLGGLVTGTGCGTTPN